MITNIQINNFKCFHKSSAFQFSKLNLLTGINGRGKSSLLQSLLVLSQTVRKNNRLNPLVINGDLIELGDFDDIKNSDTPRGTDISFNLTIEINDKLEHKAAISFKEDESNPFSAILSKFSIESNGENYDYNTDGILEQLEYHSSEHYDLVEAVKRAFTRVHYVSADRKGPVKYVDKISLSDFISVGPKGENTINVLAENNLPLVNELLYRGKDAKTIIQQTEEWLGYILEGASIEIKGKERGSSVLYMLLNNRSDSHKYKTINIGFGYSYVLPLIVSGLIAQPGDVLIIENPEAHLHPRAQSKITEFFARVASCGVQVFIESHSEHILNGLRVSALDPEIHIQPDEVSIQYFTENFNSEKLVIDKKGKIANWPDGFFDQQEIDLANIFKHNAQL